jgi:hypothetical protein
VKANQTLSLNLSTGLHFGHEDRYDAIRMENDDLVTGSGGWVVPIVGGWLVG